MAVWSFIISLVPMSWPVWYYIRNGGNFVNNFIGVLFLSSIVTFWIGIIAIILGIVALVTIRKHNLEGKRYAIAGIVVGLTPAIIGIVVLILNLIN